MGASGKKILITFIIVLLVFSVHFAVLGEPMTWDCPECGREGNTGNYCGWCAHPAPWIEKADINAMHSLTEEFKTVGNIVTFGHYEQDNDLSNGTEEIEWIVLEYDEANHKALLLSRYGLAEKAYHERAYNTEFKKVTWETCSLRTWLNNDFLNKAFYANEQNAILITEVNYHPSEDYENEKNKYSREAYSAQVEMFTQDRIFLLSYKQANQYSFATQDSLVPTTYAVSQGFKVNKVVWWWLRSSGYRGSIYADSLDYRGAHRTINANAQDIFIRPALWVNLESFLVQQ